MITAIIQCCDIHCRSAESRADDIASSVECCDITFRVQLMCIIS